MILITTNTGGGFNIGGKVYPFNVAQPLLSTDGVKIFNVENGTLILNITPYNQISIDGTVYSSGTFLAALTPLIYG